MSDDRQRLLGLYAKLLAWAGHRNWWPAETPFEVIVGAILTQSVAWRNVVKAIANLKEAGLLEPWALYRAELEEIERGIVPTRFYRAKAKKLKAFMVHLCERYGGELDRLFTRPTLADTTRRSTGWATGSALPEIPVAASARWRASAAAPGRSRASPAAGRDDDRGQAQL